jgi:hypothetical protein
MKCFFFDCTHPLFPPLYFVKRGIMALPLFAEQRGVGVSSFDYIIDI